MNIKTFYNSYHLKNSGYNKLITFNNFTYFYILRFLQKDYKNTFALNNVLDIGCGVGTLALFFSKYAKYVKGIDISSRAINIANKARNDLNIKNVSFYNEKLEVYKEKYDLIICTEVIEHIEDEKEFLYLIYKNIKKDGKLFISTPSSENILYKLGYFDKFDKEVGHLRRYTQESLVSLLEENNFKIVRIKKSDGILRTILFTSKLGFLIRFIKGPLIPMFHFIDNISRIIFGECDLLVIAKKK